MDDWDFSIPGYRLLIAFFLVILLSTFGAPSSFLAASRLVYYTLTGICLYFVVCDLAVTKHQEPNFVYWGVALITVISVLGIVEFIIEKNVLWSQFFHVDNLYYRRFTAGYQNRIVSTIGHPVYLASILVLVFPFVLYLIETGGSLFRRLSFLAAEICCLSALFLTFSRGGWFGAVVAGVTYYWYQDKKRWFWQLISALAVVGILLAVPKTREIAFSRNTYDHYSGEVGKGGRIFAYRVVMQVLTDFPFWGTGTANYRIVSGHYGDIDETPDNAYLILLADTGLLGFALFLIVLYQILNYLYDYSTFCSLRSSRDRRLVDAFLASLVGFLADAITCDAFYFSVTRIIFWITAGAGIATARNVATEEEISRQSIIGVPHS